MNFKYKSCRGEDAKHRVSTTNMSAVILKILIQNRVLGGKFYLETYRGEDAKHQQRREASKQRREASKQRREASRLYG